MKLEVWDELVPIPVSPDKLRAGLLRLKENEDFIPRELTPLYLPSVRDVAWSLKDKDYLTSMSAHELEGFRIVTIGDPPLWQGKAQIYRRDGKVIFNERVDNKLDVRGALVLAFNRGIEGAFLRLTMCAAFMPEEIAVVYSASLVRRLISETMTSRVRPRLVPGLVLPPREEILEALRGQGFDRLPLVREARGESHRLSEAREGYLYQCIGERGEVCAEVRSADLPGAIEDFVGRVSGIASINENAGFVFNPDFLGQ